MTKMLLISLREFLYHASLWRKQSLALQGFQLQESIYMIRFLKLLSVLGLVVTISTGCAVNRATATVDPATNLGALKTMYVKMHSEDNNGVNNLVAEKLRAKGVVVTTGPAESDPGKVDAVVTYIDKWMWDITMYMLELTITIREPKTDFPLASGNSLHSSLTRLSPTEMVNEVVDNIYNGGKK